MKIPGPFRRIWRIADESAVKENGNSYAEGKSAEPAREHWGSKYEFLLSCIGMSVGIGNIWRFPYLAYKNGGSAFLFPYFILLILVGKPMYLLELAIGQFAQKGPVTVWNCAPIMKGVGWSMIIISVVVSTYYNVLIAYTIFYTSASFTGTLPWTGCFDWWGADYKCYVRGVDTPLRHCDTLGSNETRNPGVNCVNFTWETASQQYFYKHVLHIHESDGLSDLGPIRWDLTLCLLIGWIIVFLCLFKGIKSSGKVVYVTATFPYLILLVLLIRGVTLDGANDGIIYLFKPKWSKIFEFQVWMEAATQLFFSLGVSMGSLIMFGSYNKFSNSIYKDAMFVSVLDTGTSIIAGVVIFSVLGSLSKEIGVPIEEVADKGPGLAFIVYPEALSRLPWPQFWSVIFFIMLFTLGLDSEFAMLETILTCMYDEWPKLRKYKTICCFSICVICFVMGLPCVTSGGQYVLDLMDVYGSGTSLLLVAIVEMVGFCWVYGLKNLIFDFHFMMGVKLGYYWKVTWAFCSPVFLTAIFVATMWNFTPPGYGPGKPYPDFAQVIGWCMVGFIMIQIPIFAIYHCVRTRIYNKEEWSSVGNPSLKWGPGEEGERTKWLSDKRAKGQQHNGRLDTDHNWNSGMTNPAFSVSVTSVNPTSPYCDKALNT